MSGLASSLRNHPPGTMMIVHSQLNWQSERALAAHDPSHVSLQHDGFRSQTHASHPASSQPAVGWSAQHGRSGKGVAVGAGGHAQAVHLRAAAVHRSSHRPSQHTGSCKQTQLSQAGTVQPGTSCAAQQFPGVPRGEGVGVGVGCWGPRTQPIREAFTAPTISSMVTSPSLLKSNRKQSRRGPKPDAMLMPFTISSIVTSPSSLQSP